MGQSTSASAEKSGVNRKLPLKEEVFI